jgi:hypothetical protein
MGVRLEDRCTSIIRKSHPADIDGHIIGGNVPISYVGVLSPDVRQIVKPLGLIDWPNNDQMPLRLRGGRQHHPLRPSMGRGDSQDRHLANAWALE